MVLLAHLNNPLPDIGEVKVFILSISDKGSVTYLVEVDQVMFRVVKKSNFMWVKKDQGLYFPDELINVIGNLIDDKTL